MTLARVFHFQSATFVVSFFSRNNFCTIGPPLLYVYSILYLTIFFGPSAYVSEKNERSTLLVVQRKKRETNIDGKKKKIESNKENKKKLNKARCAPAVSGCQKRFINLISDVQRHTATLAGSFGSQKICFIFIWLDILSVTRKIT